MATHSGTLAWKIQWMEEPGRLQSMMSLRVGHGWATSLSLLTFMHWRRKWQPTPVFLPGESQGQGSLVGCRLWGRLKWLSSSSRKKEDFFFPCSATAQPMRTATSQLMGSCYHLTCPPLNFHQWTFRSKWPLPTLPQPFFSFLYKVTFPSFFVWTGLQFAIVCMSWIIIPLSFPKSFC